MKMIEFYNVYIKSLHFSGDKKEVNSELLILFGYCAFMSMVIIDLITMFEVVVIYD